MWRARAEIRKLWPQNEYGEPCRSPVSFVHFSCAVVTFLERHQRCAPQERCDHFICVSGGALSPPVSIVSLYSSARSIASFFFSFSASPRNPSIWCGKGRSAGLYRLLSWKPLCACRREWARFILWLFRATKWKFRLRGGRYEHFQSSASYTRANPPVNVGLRAAAHSGGCDPSSRF